MIEDGAATAQALAAGIPQLVMPMAFDQFPNAARLESLGVARSLRPKAYRAPAVARALGELLNSPEVAKQCKAIAGRFQGGNRLDEACLAVEELGQESAGGGALQRRGLLAENDAFTGWLSRGLIVDRHRPNSREPLPTMMTSKVLGMAVLPGNRVKDRSPLYRLLRPAGQLWLGRS